MLVQVFEYTPNAKLYGFAKDLDCVHLHLYFLDPQEFLINISIKFSIFWQCYSLKLFSTYT